MLLPFVNPFVFFTNLSESNCPSECWGVGDVEHNVISTTSGCALDTDVSTNGLRGETHGSAVDTRKRVGKWLQLWIVDFDLLR